ncbi:B12-binding domain-containing radical SAM protein [Thermodesulfobacteriota bacterium]
MKRVLLVRPRREPRFLSLSLPPLGLMYIASYLKQNADEMAAVRILDLTIERNGRKAMARALEGFEPDLIGLSVMTPEAPDMNYFSQWFKGKVPKALVVAGGPHPNAAPEDVLSDPNIDFVCLGEGERTALALVDRLARGLEMRDLPGLAYRSNGGFARNQDVEPIEDLDSVPFPAWDLVPLTAYCSWRVLNPSLSRRRKLFTTLFTSRACPYRCTYCHNIFGRRTRLRTAENIYQEMRELEDRYGIYEFHVVDDVFNLRPDRVIALCDRIIEEKRKYHLAFVSGLRGDILTEEVLDRLVEAGTYQVSVGIESGSQRIQKAVKRNGDIQRALAMIAYARGLGVITHGFFMFGFPDETREEMAATEKVALSAKLITAAFHTVAPYPGTPLFDLLQERKRGEEIRMEEIFFKSPTMNLSNVSTSELHRAIKRAFRRFYFDRRRLMTIWRSAPRKIDVIVSAVFHLLMDPRLMRFKQWIVGRTNY